MTTAATKQKLLDELRKTPIVQVACQRVGIARATYYRWLKADDKFADAAFDAIDHGTSLINDMAESQLISSIKDKHMTGIIFWLKHHHPAYETRIQVGGKLQLDSPQLSPEQEQLVAKALMLGGLLPPELINATEQEHTNE
jgi:hypothetical protein